MERLVILFIFIFLPFFSYPLDFESYAKKTLARAISNPSLFFTEIKSDTEIVLPLKSGSDFAINYPIFPSFFPFTFIAPSLVKRIHTEGKIPQIDILGGIQYFSAGSIFANATDDVKDMYFWGGYVGMIGTNSIYSRLRNFYGFKIAYDSAKLKLTKEKKHELLGIEIDDFKFSQTSLSVILGVEIMRDINKFFSMQIDYNTTKNFIAFRTVWYGKWFELGFNFYPDGVINIHPFWNMRIYF